MMVTPYFQISSSPYRRAQQPLRVAVQGPREEVVQRDNASTTGIAPSSEVSSSHTPKASRCRRIANWFRRVFAADPDLVEAERERARQRYRVRVCPGGPMAPIFVI